MAATATANADVTIGDLRTNRANYAVGENIGFSLKLTNTGTEPVEKIYITFRLNGDELGGFQPAGKIEPGRSMTVSESIPTAVASQLRNAEFSAEIESIGNEFFDNPEKAATHVSFYNTLFDRKAVIEEGTGTWCGFCVRGILAFEELKEKYPESFIGIAIHDNDPMAAKEYFAASGLGNLPRCNIDRRINGISVEPATIGDYFTEALEQKSVGKISVAAASADGKKLDIKTKAAFVYDGEDSYNVAYVLLEDNISGYKQHNSYAGGAMGAMGGYEDKPEYVEMDYNDVALGIFPEYGGTLMTSKESSENETAFDYTLTLPENIRDRKNLSLVALLIDPATGEIVNADKIKLNLKDENGGDDPGTGDDPSKGDYKYVDLGVGPLWSAANMLGKDGGFLQAASEEICGGYFGWADPTGLLTETEDSYYPQGEVPESITGTSLDIAHEKWGGLWRLPTHDEVIELYNNCDVESETVNGVAGRRFKSKVNGNSIFLPYAGSRYGEDVWSLGEYGTYWTGTLNNEPLDGIYFAFALDFDDSAININNVCYRFDGCSVRPVCDRAGNGVEEASEENVITRRTYLTVDGKEVSDPATGIYIVVEKYADGHTKTRKILKK